MARMAGVVVRSYAATNHGRLGRRSRETARCILLAAMATLVAFVGLEGALGIVPRNERRVLSRSSRLGTTALDCYPTNPRGYFDLDLQDPDARSRFERLGVRRVEDCASHAPFAVEYRYNSLQFRDREPGPRRRGVHRLMVLGDSFTEGQGVREPDAYPRVLEATLNAEDWRAWEVFNFGRRGADFPALQDNFEQLLPLDPDVVVYGMVLNDCEQSPRFRARDPLLSDWLTGRGRHGLPARTQPFGFRTASFVRTRIDRVRVDRGTSDWYGALYGWPNREGWTSTQDRIRAMDRRMRERGGRFVVVIWPMLTELHDRYPYRNVHDAISRFCREAGIPCFDLLQTLQGRRATALWVHPVDPHPNEIAHRLVADELAPLVRHLVDEDRILPRSSKIAERPQAFPSSAVEGRRLSAVGRHEPHGDARPSRPWWGEEAKDVLDIGELKRQGRRR
jgi:lysophospholipase L1-like esterase